MNCKIFKLTVCGIKNISQPVSFNFYKKVVDYNSCFDDYRIKGIYGENGSGKTAVMLGVKLLKNLVVDMDYLKDDSTRKAINGIINQQKRAGFIEILAGIFDGDRNYLYRYKLNFALNNLNNFEIRSEELFIKARSSRNQEHLVFKTDEGRLNYYFDEKFTETIKDFSQNLLKEQTLLSILLSRMSTHEGQMREILDDTILGFTLICHYILIKLDKYDEYKDQLLFSRYIQSLWFKDESTKDQLTSYLLMQHLTEEEFSYFVKKNNIDNFESYIKKLNSFISIFKPDLKNIEIEKTEAADYFKCDLVFNYDFYRISLGFESRGIKKLVALFDSLYMCSNGFIVFIDELDLGINSIYLSKIVEYLADFGCGQLCFTAHDLGIMKVLKDYKKSIDFLSSVNTVHSWSRKGNTDPESAYRKGFIEDSPYNIDAVDFIGVLGGNDE